MVQIVVRSKRPCLMDDKVYVSEYCDQNCSKCGWNPKINRERRNKLRQLAKEGRLREWGDQSARHETGTLKEESVLDQ